MKTLRLVALSIVVGLFAESGTTCAATYTYSGGNFVDVLGDYTTMMRVTGQFTVAVPLAPNLPFTDITALVTSYSFGDGVQDADRGKLRAPIFFCEYRCNRHHRHMEYFGRGVGRRLNKSNLHFFQ